MTTQQEWPTLGIEERSTAYDATPRYTQYAEYIGIKTLHLGQLLLVEEHLGEVKQLAREKQLDPGTVKGITQSLESVGILSNQPLMIVVKRPIYNDDKYIVVEGNNRLAAFRSLATSRGLNPDVLPMTVLEVEITTDEFDFGLGALGHQYNQNNLFSVANKGYNDAVNLGKAAIKAGYFTYKTPEEIIFNWLKYDQGVQLADGHITRAARAILSRSTRARHLIQHDKDSAAEVINASRSFGANGNEKKVAKYKLYAAPLNQTVRTAINNFSSYRSLDEETTMRVVLWDSTDDVDDIEDNRIQYARIWYEEYRNAWSFINDMHNVDDGPMSPLEFFEYIGVEFWILSQVRGTDVFDKNANCELVYTAGGKMHYIYRWFPEEMAEVAEPKKSKKAA